MEPTDATSDAPPTDGTVVDEPVTDGTLTDEARAGRMQADLVDGTTTTVILRSQDLVEKWIPKVDFASRYVDPEGYWVASNEYVLTPGYNEELVPAAVRPKTWDDLLDPRWKLAGEQMPEKIEGLCLGPQLPDGRQTLLLSSDNDFESKNASLIWVFALPAPKTAK